MKPTPEELAGAFVLLLMQVLPYDEIKMIQARNATPEYAGCCASHDFVDANMTMLEAWETLGGGSIYGDTAAANNNRIIWNRAWDIAKARYLTKETT